MTGAPLAAGLGGVLLFLAAGLGLVELFPSLRGRPRAARFGWAYLLGVAAVPGTVYVLGVLFDVRLRRGVVLVPVVVFVLAGAAARFLRRRVPPPEPPAPPRLARVLAAAAFVAGAVVTAGLFSEAVTARESGWDSEMTWSAAARWIRADRSVTPRAFRDGRVYVHLAQYPVLMPLAQVVVQETFSTDDDPRVIKPLYAAFLPALLLVLFDLARRHAGSAAAALVCFALPLLPSLVLDQSGGAAGAYSDVPLGAFWGAGLLLLLGRAGASDGIAAGVLLAAAVLTKNEGLPDALSARAAGALAAVVARRSWRARAPALAAAAGAVVAAAALLFTWKSAIPMRWDPDYVGRLRTLPLAEAAATRLPSLPAAAVADMASARNWAGFWPAAALAFVAGSAGLRRRVVPPILLALSGAAAAYLLAILVSTWDAGVQLHSTWNRFLLQLSVPVGVLLALALRPGLRARAAAAELFRRADIIDPMPSEAPRERRFGREALVFLAFLALTVLMTWPWALHVRDHCSDAGDPYLNSWILWWDFHQTFRDPLHLFDGNIFFPYKLSLAFSEHNYGLALPLFPLFALGLRPLTAQSLLTLLGFAFSGYGAFRLARTLTGSTGAAWVSGIAFAFVPYRFGQLPHVNYLFSGWLPILLEAAVLFVRERTPKRALWLGAAFFLNGLSVIHWLVLGLIPLAGTFLLAAFRSGAERDRRTWTRAALAVGVAGIALLPWLLPYQRAAKLYGFTRNVEETRDYSAQLKDWMNADPRNHLWRGFSEFPTPGERALFPGLLLLALPLAALLLSPRGEEVPPDVRERPPSPRVLRALDAVALVSGFVAVFAASPAGIHVRLAGREVFKATEPWRAAAVFLVAVGVRWWLAYPAALPFVSRRRLADSVRAIRREEAVVVGGFLALVGFFGSFGVRFPFHRLLFETVFLFRSIRVPARWSMIAYLGLALLAGAGVRALAQAWRRRRPDAPAGALFALAGVLFLLEDRAAPLDLLRGEADPDQVTRFLAATPMKGGIVVLPSNTPDRGNYGAVLRAADHGKPLVTAVSGFGSPVVERIDEDSRKSPVPDGLMDFLEGIPVSYILVHDSWLTPDARAPLREWLARGIASGRLVFVKRFDGVVRNDLLAVAKVEPAARSLEPLPWRPPDGRTPAGTPWTHDVSLTGSIDVPEEGATVHGTLRTAGWARIPGEDLHVIVLIDGEQRPLSSGARVPRPDVCAAVPNLADCSHAGWEATYEFRPEDAGPHEIQPIFRSKDGRERRYQLRRFTWAP